MFLKKNIIFIITIYLEILEIFEFVVYTIIIYTVLLVKFALP